MKFEDDFPSLKGKRVQCNEYLDLDCIDKTQVRKAIRKHITSKPTCNGFYNLTSLDIKEFEKELGL